MERCVEAGRVAYLLDGDNLRHGLSDDLGFSAGDRAENIRRVGHLTRLLADSGVVALASLVSPLKSDRELARAHVPARYAIAADIQLSDDAYRHRLQQLIQYIYLHVRQRRADAHPLGCCILHRTTLHARIRSHFRAAIDVCKLTPG